MRIKMFSFTRKGMLQYVNVYAVITFVAFAILFFYYRLKYQKYNNCRMFKDVLTQLIEYGNDYGLPGTTIVDAEGNDLYSWRYEQHLYLDPVFEHTRLPVGARLHWNSPEHRQITDAGYGRNFRSGNIPFSTIFAIVGEDTGFVERQLPGGLDREVRHRPGDLPDDLILIIQVKQNLVLWNQPGDCNFSDNDAISASKLSDWKMTRGGACVGFNDGQVWHLSEKTPLSTLRTLSTIGGAKSHSREDELAGFVYNKY